MLASWRILLLPVLLAALTPILAVSDPTAAETTALTEHNRRLFEKYRADPEHYQRLVTELRAFQA